MFYFSISVSNEVIFRKIYFYDYYLLCRYVSIKLDYLRNLSNRVIFRCRIFLLVLR